MSYLIKRAPRRPLKYQKRLKNRDLILNKSFIKMEGKTIWSISTWEATLKLHQRRIMPCSKAVFQSVAWRPPTLGWFGELVKHLGSWLHPRPTELTEGGACICILTSTKLDKMVKNPSAKAGDPGLIPGLVRTPGEGNGYPLQYFCLENSMTRGAWGAIVRKVAKNLTQLSD